MKIFFICFWVLFLVGCVENPPISSFLVPTEKKQEVAISPVLRLDDVSGDLVGWGIFLKNGIFVAPDHLWQTAGTLYAQHRPITVLARDFRHDIIFFRTKTPSDSYEVVWKNVPPAAGETLFWFRGSKLKKTRVVSVKTEFLWESITIKDLCLVEGALEHGDSGLPLFNQKGEIYGFLVATDTQQQRSFAVRADMVISLAEEYLGNEQ